MKQLNNKKAASTNRELAQIKIKYGLTYKQLAELTEVSIDSVKGYFCHPDSARYTVFLERNLKFLKLVIEVKKMEPKES